MLFNDVMDRAVHAPYDITHNLLSDIGNVVSIKSEDNRIRSN